MTVPLLWYNFIIMGGKIGVDVFVLISGYFLISGNGRLFNIKRILKFWGQVLFYSVGLFVLFTAVGNRTFEIKSMIKSLFPITFSSWWFASTYFVLYLIHPFLNMLLNGMSRKAYQAMLVLLVILWSAIPTFTTSQNQSNSLIWFVTLYAIAGYARLYGFNKKLTSKHYFLLWAVFSALTYASSVVFSLMGTKWAVFAENATYFYGQEKVPALLISVTLFMAFATLKMNCYRWINTISSATFGVYLLHENSFVRRFLWREVFTNAQYQDSLLLIPYSVAVVAAVYIVCTAVDLIRQVAFEKPYMRLVNRFTDVIAKPLVRLGNFINGTLFE